MEAPPRPLLVPKPLVDAAEWAKDPPFLVSREGSLSAFSDVKLSWLDRMDTATYEYAVVTRWVHDFARLLSVRTPPTLRTIVGAASAGPISVPEDQRKTLLEEVRTIVTLYESCLRARQDHILSRLMRHFRALVLSGDPSAIVTTIASLYAAANRLTPEQLVAISANISSPPAPTFPSGSVAEDQSARIYASTLGPTVKDLKADAKAEAKRKAQQRVLEAKRVGAAESQKHKDDLAKIRLDSQAADVARKAEVDRLKNELNNASEKAQIQRDYEQALMEFYLDDVKRTVDEAQLNEEDRRKLEDMRAKFKSRLSKKQEAAVLQAENKTLLDQMTINKLIWDKEHATETKKLKDEIANNARMAEIQQKYDQAAVDLLLDEQNASLEAKISDERNKARLETTKSKYLEQLKAKAATLNLQVEKRSWIDKLVLAKSLWDAQQEHLKIVEQNNLAAQKRIEELQLKEANWEFQKAQIAAANQQALDQQREQLLLDNKKAYDKEIVRRTGLINKMHGRINSAEFNDLVKARLAVLKAGDADLGRKYQEIIQELYADLVNMHGLTREEIAEIANVPPNEADAIKTNMGFVLNLHANIRSIEKERDDLRTALADCRSSVGSSAASNAEELRKLREEYRKQVQDASARARKQAEKQCEDEKEALLKAHKEEKERLEGQINDLINAAADAKKKLKECREGDSENLAKARADLDNEKKKLKELLDLDKQLATQTRELQIKLEEARDALQRERSSADQRIKTVLEIQGKERDETNKKLAAELAECRNLQDQLRQDLKAAEELKRKQEKPRSAKKRREPSKQTPTVITMQISAEDAERLISGLTTSGSAIEGGDILASSLEKRLQVSRQIDALQSWVKQQPTPPAPEAAATEARRRKLEDALKEELPSIDDDKEELPTQRQNEGEEPEAKRRPAKK